jgi:glycosyltransferase involved in cell wall biosynthesis
VDAHLISVVIPCFRQAHYLGEAIDSVLAQSHRAWEVVVVDDGSPDDPRAVVDRYPSSVRYVRQENRGVAAARNRGIEASTGRYLVFLDADDRLLRDHFALNLEGFRAHGDAGFVCGDYRWFGGEGASESVHVHDCRPEPDHYATLLRRNFIGPPHVVMFRRDVLDRVGGFRPDIVPAEDQDLFLRVARAHPIHCHHAVIAEYRRHGGQASQRYDRMLRSSLRMLRQQWPYARENPSYRAAYRAGVRFRQRLYQGPLHEQLAASLRARRWGAAARAALTFLSYDPAGFGSAVRARLRRPALRRRT